MIFLPVAHNLFCSFTREIVLNPPVKRYNLGLALQVAWDLYLGNNRGAYFIRTRFVVTTPTRPEEMSELWRYTVSRSSQLFCLLVISTTQAKVVRTNVRWSYDTFKCSSVRDLENYVSFSECATSGAESVNHLWVSSKSYLRFINLTYVMPFILAGAVFLNTRSRVREQSGKSEVNAKMLREYLLDAFTCNHQHCHLTN